MKPCVHRWIYHSSAEGRCAYGVCAKCGEIVWFAKKGCK